MHAVPTASDLQSFPQIVTLPLSALNAGDNITIEIDSKQPHASRYTLPVRVGLVVANPTITTSNQQINKNERGILIINGTNFDPVADNNVITLFTVRRLQQTLFGSKLTYLALDFSLTEQRGPIWLRRIIWKAHVTM